MVCDGLQINDIKNNLPADYIYLAMASYQVREINYAQVDLL